MMNQFECMDCGSDEPRYLMEWKSGFYRHDPPRLRVVCEECAGEVEGLVTRCMRLVPLPAE